MYANWSSNLSVNNNSSGWVNDTITFFENACQG